jgi:uncharacterized protein (TIGR03435 family)
MSDHGKLEEAEKTIARNQQVAMSFRRAPAPTDVVAHGAGKLGAPAPRTSAADRPGGLSYMADWLTLLPSVGHPIVDHTGLAGSFSFHANLFNLEKGTPPDQMKRAMVNSDASDILRMTLPEQLGLKLESQRASIEMLVIDHADKVPVEN